MQGGFFFKALTSVPDIAGRDPAEVQRGRPEEERDHHPLPGDAERHPGPNRGAQHPQHQAVPGEQRPGREAEGAHIAVRPAREGTDPDTHARTGSKQRLKSGSINPNLHANPPDIT